MKLASERTGAGSALTSILFEFVGRLLPLGRVILEKHHDPESLLTVGTFRRYLKRGARIIRVCARKCP